MAAPERLSAEWGSAIAAPERLSAKWGSAIAAPERLSAAWGSAGAISGPPQMKSSKEVNDSPQEPKGVPR
jgi:hypothetical protein